MAGLIVAGIFLPARAKESAPAAKPAPAKAVMPPAVARPVDFEKEVVPIFQASCVNCHSSGKTEADLSIETREKLLEGGATSPAIEPGKSADSLLIHLVSGMDEDPDRVMPQKGKRLTPEQIGILRAWIDQGANWPAGFLLTDPTKPVPAKLEPREVKIPAAHDGLTNPIDLLLEPYFAQHKVEPKGLVDDRVYARRVYLDIIGLLPTPDDLEKFVADSSTDKRAKLVHALLDDKERYAAHWLAMWNDLLRNDYKGTGYIDGGRLQVTRWLYDSLVANKPYDQFVRELVSGAKGAEGFTKGIVWRGVVNAAQTPQMQAAQNIGQVFMGVNLKCASCHDSFINQWKLTDSYGFAGIYADKALEMERCTKPLGKTASMKFLYPELGEIDQSAPREKRIAQLASIVTHEKNGRLTRTIVNRLWQRLMGRGLIEPADEMDHAPWNADVLDALAWDLSRQHYDLKKTIETIVLSRAYQLPAMPLEEHPKEFVFAGPTVKRMSAEQFVDAVSAVSGIWPAKQDAKLTDAAERYAKTKWIWATKDAAKSADPGKVFLRRAFNLKTDVAAASVMVAVDNKFELWINGKRAGGGESWDKPTVIDVKANLVNGKNVMAVIAENFFVPIPAAKPTTAKATTSKTAATQAAALQPTTANSVTPNPAGFWLNLVVTSDEEDPKVTQIGTTAAWKWSKNAPPANWSEVGFDDSKWSKAAVVGDVAIEPWKLATLLPDEDPANQGGKIRAAFLAADPLSTALGRPNRDQVNTARASAATTLMALELTNGVTLTDVLARGAKKMAVEKDIRAEDLIGKIYVKAIGRAPTPAETATAKEVVGPNVNETGVEDLLWAVIMLPEFQLIR